MSAHSWGAGRQGLDADVIAALREGQPLVDARLEALRVFVRALILKRGAVPEADQRAFSRRVSRAGRLLRRSSASQPKS
jgi:hypothetical protein